MASYDIGGDAGDRATIYADEKYKKGFFVTKRTAVLLTVLAIVVLALVAVLFYFLPVSSTEPGEGTPAPGEDIDPLPQRPTDPPPTEDPRGPFDGRLPDSLVPEHYNIWLKTYLDNEDGPKQFTYEGVSTVELRCEKDTDIIKIHFLSLNIDYQSVQVFHLDEEDRETKHKISIKNIYTEEIYDFLVIEVEDTLRSGEIYSVTIGYDAILNTNPLFGYYLTSYKVGDETRWLSAAVFQPNGARMTFPCLDEPNLKATFDIAMVHRPKRRALANMNEIAFENDGDWNTTHFNRSVLMPTYLVSFSLTDFPSLEMTTPNDVLFRVWAREEDIDAANYSLYIGSAMLTFFEDYYSLPYPMPKMDMIASPEFISGALECWGHILYDENAMLYDPKVHPPTRQKRVAEIVAHELVHMWFGNLVTLDWWDHLWLNEGFATFLPYIAVEKFHPEWKIWDQFLTDDMASAMSADSTSSRSKPLVRTTGWVDEIWSMFDTMSYSKADLEDRNTDVKEIMDPWALQSGFPVVTVIRTAADMVEINQTHFLLDPNDEPSDEFPNLGFKWYVPLTYTYKSRDQFYPPLEAMLSPDTDKKQLRLEGTPQDDWVLFNINKQGYFRVNYDTDNWVKLAEQLKTDHKVFPTQTRASILDDCLIISQPGYVDHVYGLRLTEYLYYEEEYAPWQLVLRALPFTHGMLLRTSEFGMFEKYWRSQIVPLYLSVGWNFTNSDLLDYYQRINAIETACRYGNEDCIEVSKSLYRAWMEDPGNDPTPDEVNEIVYCTAIRHGGPAEWQFAYDQSKSSSPGTRTLLENAMGCSRDSWQLQYYLEDYHSDGRSRVAIDNIRDKSSLGYSTAWEFTMTRFEELLNIYGNSSFDIVWDFADLMTTRYDHEKLHMFGTKHRDMPASAASGFYRAVEIVETNIAWMDRNQESIREWLVDVTSNMPDVKAHARATDGVVEHIKTVVSGRRHQSRASLHEFHWAKPENVL
ncbi:aminopeptidase N-like isoform X2 [Ptychodera flava]|uniref:aminopeptidase N-like isoform X2 n=1 Tax=Ptychodera flava TaxID=63121 RepID=UPI00396A55D8